MKLIITIALRSLGEVGHLSLLKIKSFVDTTELGQMSKLKIRTYNYLKTMFIERNVLILLNNARQYGN